MDNLIHFTCSTDLLTFSDEEYEKAINSDRLQLLLSNSMLLGEFRCAGEFNNVSLTRYTHIDPAHAAFIIKDIHVKDGKVVCSAKFTNKLVKRLYEIHPESFKFVPRILQEKDHIHELVTIDIVGFPKENT